MQSLPDALAFVRKGWNPADEIRDRAEAGNYERAEEYALEIEQLQAAAGMKPLAQPAWATHQRKLGYVAWFNILQRGYLAGRTFWMGAPCKYADYDSSAVGSAQMLFSNTFITERDIL